MDDAILLPYRTGPEELTAWVEARARGHSGGAAGKSAEGAAATARALGLLGEGDELTAAGRRFALATAAERRSLLLGAMRAFAPYRGVMEAVRARGQGGHSTDVGWIETWWATRGYGNSPSNRREGGATFGRLVEWTGLGRYIPGRRGHPTRIQWTVSALAGEGGAPTAAFDLPPALPPASKTRSSTDLTATRPAAAAPGENPAPSPTAGGVSRVTVELAPGRVARLEVPARLGPAEKRRLLDLLDLLISER